MKYQTSHTDIKNYSKKYAYSIILISIALFSWTTYKSLINITTIASTALLSLFIISINEFLKNKSQEILAIISFIAIIFFAYIILREIKLGNLLGLQMNAAATILGTYGLYGIIIKHNSKNKNDT